MEEEKRVIEENNNSSILPVVQKDKDLLKKGNRADVFRRIGKIAKGAAFGLTALTVGVVGSTVIPYLVPGVIGAGIGTGVMIGGMLTGVKGLFDGAKNLIYREESDLMFVTKRNTDNSIGIYQNTKVNLARNMKEYTPEEKGAMMQLQGLVGFSRYKDSLVGSSHTVREDGTKVYDQLFSTQTHSVNLRTFEAMEKLGYIEIVKKDDKLARTLFTRKPKEKKSLLLFERLGFENKRDLSEIRDAIKNRDREALDKKKRTMEKWTFKMTDKPINFAELYAKYQGLIPCESVEEKKAVRTFCMIFNSKHGILTQKNIDIGKDEYGRDVLLYGVEENFAARTDREIDKPALLAKAIAEGRKLNMPVIRAKAEAERQAQNPEGLSEFDLSLRQGVDQGKVEAVLDEHRENVRQDLADDGKLNGSNVKGKNDSEITNESKENVK